MKISTRNARVTQVAAKPATVVRMPARGGPQNGSAQRRRDGTELRFHLLLAALRPSGG